MISADDTLPAVSIKTLTSTWASKPARWIISMISCMIIFTLLRDPAGFMTCYIPIAKQIHRFARHFQGFVSDVKGFELNF